MSILESFPGTPRQVQTDVLLELEKNYFNNDVFILQMPVGAGKSRAALAITKWVSKQKKTSSILTKDKVLVNQYAGDFPRLAVLRAAGDYPCVTHRTVARAKTFYKKTWKSHREVDKCKGCTSYFTDLKKAMVSKRAAFPLLCNMHIHLAHKMSKDVLIVDEAHNLVPFLQELHTKKFWRHDLPYPSEVWSRLDFKNWLADSPEIEAKELRAELNREVPRHSLVRKVENYHGRPEEVLHMVPFDIRGAAPFMWPGKKTKLIFLSATMNHKDLQRIGLEDRRWVIINSDSPIPPEQRPIILDAHASMTYLSVKRNVPRLIEEAEKLWHSYEKSRGLIHVTYGISALLKQHVSANSTEVPFIFHSPTDKMQRLREWQETPDGILIACGLSEGLDLKDDKARWQMVGKVPWPSLADPVTAEWARRDHEAYVWETLKAIIQMSGRVCRGPDDFGATHIFDSQINRLLSLAEEAKLVPQWWSNAVKERRNGSS